METGGRPAAVAGRLAGRRPAGRGRQDKPGPPSPTAGGGDRLRNPPAVKGEVEREAARRHMARRGWVQARAPPPPVIRRVG